MKQPRAFEQALHQLYAGQLTFDRFAGLTVVNWRGMAINLMHRWGRDSGQQVEDLTQELLVAAWAITPKWDPARGCPLGKFVVWRAYDQAKTVLHRGRGANLHVRDRAPSRAPIAFSNLGPDERRTANRVAMLASTPARQLDLLEQDERWRRVMQHCRTARERWACAALAATDGRVDLAAKKLYDDPDARRHCRLGCERQARQVVGRTLFFLARRAAAA